MKSVETSFITITRYNDTTSPFTWTKLVYRYIDVPLHRGPNMTMNNGENITCFREAIGRLLTCMLAFSLEIWVTSFCWSL